MLISTQKKHIIGYVLLFITIIVLDRCTKYWALQNLKSNSIAINSILSFDLVFNRGITTGLLSSDSSLLFILLTCFISFITIILFLYSYYRWRMAYIIIGEILVLAGAISNLIDRMLYNGVVDFIHLSYQSYSFPIFNIADAAIVIGIGIMFFIHIRET